MQRSLYPLDPEFVPPALKYRTSILYNILDRITDKTHQNFWITGEAGSGKTLTGTFLMNECITRRLAYPVRFVCKDSIKKSVREVAKDLGLPTSFCWVTDIAREVLNRADGLDIVVIFDELQDLSQHPNARQSFNAAVFDLYESLREHYNRDKHQGCSMIFSSQLSFSIRNILFSSGTLSRLNLHPIACPSYDALQIAEILRDRVKLMPLGIDEKLNHLIIYLTSIVYSRMEGDCRKALGILLEAFRHGEGKEELTIEDVEYAITEEKTRFWNEIMEKLKPHSKLLLYLIAKNVKKDGYESKCEFVKIHNEYEHILKKIDVSPMSMKMNYYYLDNLEQNGWIQQETTTQKKVLDFGAFTYIKRKNIWLTGDRENILNAGNNINWEDVKF